MENDIKNKIANLRSIQAKLEGLEKPSFTALPVSGGIKGILKKIIRKNVMWMLAPYEEQLNKRIDMEKYLIDEIGNILTIVETEIQNSTQSIDKNALVQLRAQVDENKHRIEKDDVLRDTVREVMQKKWSDIDAKRQENELPDDILSCKICGSSHKRSEYDTMITECQFGGGELVRYVCPECGVVFGPSKFAVLTDEQKGADYNLHYSGYDEGDSLDKELRAFYLLEPDKNKVYLDYGCGRWSGTVKLLREQGYNVYGYEPYAAETGNPYIITGRDDISRMKFDGIFSNDLLEHLFDPVEDFKFMRTLLKDKNSKMSHSTSCYEYVHETTRFHTHFFLGDSVNVLCKKSGFALVEKCDDLKENDFICCIFKPEGDFENERKNVGYEMIDKLFCEGERLTGRTNCTLKSGGVMFGPYITCSPMKYTLNIYAVTAEELEFKITSLKGSHVLHEGKIGYGMNTVTFECFEKEHDVEFIIINPNSEAAVIKSIMLV